MKKIIFSIAIVLLGMNTYAKSVSESKVPATVKNTFHQEFPKAEHVKWEKTFEEDYKVSFKTGDRFSTVYYSPDGAFVESDITLEWKEVPLTGRMEIYHLNKKGHISNVLKIVTPKETFYQIDVKRRGKLFEILLDHEGNIIG